MRRVVVHRPDAVGAEQVGKHPGHHPAVLHHVGDARRRAQVVLEHPEHALAVADDVDAGDVDAHAVRRPDAGGVAVEVLTRRHQPARHHAVAQDLLVAVDVVEETLQRAHPLGDAGLQSGPLGRRDHPGNQVQREGALLAGQRESDALVDECPPERLGAGAEFIGAGGRELGVDAPVGRPHPALRVEHLVEGGRVRAGPGVAAEDRGAVGPRGLRLRHS